MILIRKLRTFDWTSLQNLGTLGFFGFFFHDAWLLFFIFYLIPLVELFQRADRQEEGPKPSSREVRNFYASYFMSQLNPYVLFYSSLQMFGQFIVWIRHWRGFPSKENYTSPVHYRLPFKGTWKVVNGGVEKRDSHSWSLLAQRYAYDFVQVDGAGKTHRGDGKKLEDYYCWGAPVVSPASGVVVTVKDGIRDFPKVGDSALDWKTRDFRGNFVIIRHTSGEYSFTAHFKKDSIVVRPGEEVRAGQLLGRCGNSGHSTEPHIHFQVQDHPSFWLSMGLPVHFHQLKVGTTQGGEKNHDRTYIRKSENVTPLEAQPDVRSITPGNHLTTDTGSAGILR